MTIRHFRLAHQARADLDGIASYVGERNPAAADRIIDTLIDSFSTLAKSPEIGTRRYDIRPGVRIFSPSRPAHNYVVIFYEEPDGVEIAAVIHSAREWPELFISGER